MNLNNTQVDNLEHVLDELKSLIKEWRTELGLSEQEGSKLNLVTDSDNLINYFNDSNNGENFMIDTCCPSFNRQLVKPISNVLAEKVKVVKLGNINIIFSLKPIKKGHYSEDPDFLAIFE